MAGQLLFRVWGFVWAGHGLGWVMGP